MPSTVLLDDLLAGIARSLQLTETQQKRAETAYMAVGSWLGASDSSLNGLRPSLYPQGSMALGTTTKPRIGEEFDLDFVIEIMRVAVHPLAFQKAVYDRLREHSVYSEKVELKNRAVRVNFAGEFHMDILPGRSAIQPPAIDIPDRELRCWMPSNPRGFIAWFESRCEEAMVQWRLRAQTPLPPQPPADLKPVLKRVVQLLKRHRDVVFRGDEDAPRSIILTTLAGYFYQGQASPFEALMGVLNGIAIAIATTDPKRLVIRNPSYAAEVLSDAFTDRSYRKFVDFIGATRERLGRLQALEGPGIDRITRELKAMFGEIAQQVVGDYAAATRDASRQGALRVGASGITTAVTGTRIVPLHRFYGGDSEG